MNKRMGLTVVEAMVIIVLLTIVVAIVVPLALDRAAHSRRVACQRSMGLIYLAVAMYGNDHGDQLPLTKADLFWMSSYLSTSDFNGAFCPDFVLAGTNDKSRGYGFNRKFQTIRPNQAQGKALFWDGRDLAKEEDPGGVFDCRFGNHQASWVTHRHCNSTANIGYFDGHVKVSSAGGPDMEVFKP